MKRWTFFGRVIPERLPLKIPGLLKGRSTVDAVQMEYDWEIGIADSQVIVSIAIIQGDTDIHTLRNFATSNVQDFTDLIGYQNGLSLDVEIISAISHDADERVIFGIAIPALAARRKPEEMGQIKSDLLLAIGPEPAAHNVLADLREAMRAPADTGFFCYRAVEAIMQSMKSDDREDEKQVWSRLRDTLQIDRSAMNVLVTHAQPARHGKPANISDDDRVRVFEITDEIIRTYLEYLLRGKVTLPVGDFPMLTA